LSIKPEKFSRFSKKIFQVIEMTLTTLLQPQNPKRLKSIAIMLHTLKGDARVLGLVAISSRIHELESLIDFTRILSPEKLSQVQKKTEELNATVTAYNNLAQEIGWGQTIDRSLSGPHLQRVLEFFLKTPETQISNDVRESFSQAKLAVTAHYFETLPNLLADIVHSLGAIADHLDKHTLRACHQTFVP